MFLKWSLPLEVFFISDNQFDVKDICFETNGLKCSVEFETSPSQFVEKKKDYDSFCFSVSKKIEFILFDEQDGDENKILSIINNKEKLLKTSVRLSNRLIRCFRVFGFVKNIHEIVVSDKSNHIILDSLDHQVSRNKIDWNSIKDSKYIMKDSLTRLLTSPNNTSVFMQLDYWSKVEEAIINNISPSAEIELAINAMEYLELKNYRLAVLDSVIGLEIVLTSFLREYLKNQKGFDKRRIDDFLAPEFGLFSRLSGLLDLTINQKSLKDINIKLVKTVVKWRNKIVHSTGDVPDGVIEQQIQEGIGEVLKLLFILHNKKEYIIKNPNRISLLGDLV